ncbi:uncharacterized protein UMAG_04089 [Mycosarcoma maydis]|uniref:HNH nuclease domain-containing protein n=1 Tax=Mycosarcoma maydis TaxID=5270 RepID=A0A0D1C2V3_MYCMD|nr:uncharacterized protein UMAG_04089 [Ustilago maydis 521]KIS68047.1 hypothetical protein UMAG_04089 [Ustilago maydis 521]|eukprot:XP_011390522.1 hypothetical protein UMAG_04089 [Ustilago maydis 521]
MSSSSIEPQQESHQRIGYDTSARKWAGQGIAVISDRSGQVLLSVPIQFLSQGLVNNFGFVLQSIHMSYDVKDGQIRSEQDYKEPASPSLYCDPDGPLTKPTTSPHLPDTEIVCCRPRIGPRFKFMSRPPHAGDDLASTMSDSKRSSANQYYTEVLGDAPTSLFQTQFGILLRDDIHHAFDRGHIALYPLMNAENELVVHIFYPETQSQKEFHGKILRPMCDQVLKRLVCFLMCAAFASTCLHQLSESDLFVNPDPIASASRQAITFPSRAQRIARDEPPETIEKAGRGADLETNGEM